MRRESTMAREVKMTVVLSAKTLSPKDPAEVKIWLGIELGWTIDEDGIFKVFQSARG